MSHFQSMKPSSNFSKLDELRPILVGSIFDIFGISESWLKPYISNRAVEIYGYKFIRNDRLSSRGSGVGLYISTALKYKTVWKASDLGVCESLLFELCFEATTLVVRVANLPNGYFASFENFHFGNIQILL